MSTQTMSTQTTMWNQDNFKILPDQDTLTALERDLRFHPSSGDRVQVLTRIRLLIYGIILMAFWTKHWQREAIATQLSQPT